MVSYLHRAVFKKWAPELARKYSSVVSLNTIRNKCNIFKGSDDILK